MVGATEMQFTYGSSPVVSSPAIYGERIVWHDSRSGDYDIYLLELGGNSPPSANAGSDQSVHAGTTVTLDGSGSSDPDGDYPLGYAWQIVSKPDGSAAALSDPAAVSPSFIADVVGDYAVQLSVTDSRAAASAADQVSVSTVNAPPVAAAGPDRSVTLVGTVVQLNGEQSYDPDGDPVTYQWTITSKPAGSLASLSDPASAAPNFTADVNGSYEIGLVASDPWTSGAADLVTVGQRAPQEVLRQLIQVINGLDPGCFKNANMPKALTNKINAVLAAIRLLQSL